jgi:hypothetical protein
MNNQSPLMSYGGAIDCTRRNLVIAILVIFVFVLLKRQTVEKKIGYELPLPKNWTVKIKNLQ